MSNSYLTLDLAKMSGFCNWTPGTKPVISNSDIELWYQHEYGHALFIHHKRLVKNIEKYGVTHICFERPIKLKTDSVERLRKIYGLSNMVEFVCDQMGIGCSEVAINTWRSHVLTHGQLPSKEAKRQAMNIAYGLGYEPKSNDEAEALCIMFYLADILNLKPDWIEPARFRLRDYNK